MMDMNILQLLETTGGRLFLGGIAGAALSLLLSLILIPAFSAAKRKMIKRINSELDEMK